MAAEDFRTNLFLAEIKGAISSGKFTVIPREKNNDFLAKLGMTPKEREKVILSLEPKHYYKGPERDRDDPNGDIWVFLIEYNNIEIYIKLKLIPTTNSFYGKCISFHD